MQYVVCDLQFFASAKKVDKFVVLAILVFASVKKVAHFVRFTRSVLRTQKVAFFVRFASAMYIISTFPLVCISSCSSCDSPFGLAAEEAQVGESFSELYFGFKFRSFILI